MTERFSEVAGHKFTRGESSQTGSLQDKFVLEFQKVAPFLHKAAD